MSLEEGYRFCKLCRRRTVHTVLKPKHMKCTQCGATWKVRK